jgi:hypothetical protein
MPGVHLVYQYFKVQPRPPEFNAQQAAERQREYEECLHLNFQHDHVERVHILLENEEDRAELEAAMSRCSETQKLKAVMLGRRMQYRDAFSYCNEHLSGKISVILNTDIFLGEGVDLVLEQRDTLWNRNVVLSLTRHEKAICAHQKSGTTSLLTDEASSCGCPFMRCTPRGRSIYSGSHDSFWFLPPIQNALVETVGHVQNRWGSEHSVINAFLNHGYEVLNPSRTIRTYHNHASALRPWKDEPGADEWLADPRDHKPLPPTTL